LGGGFLLGPKKQKKKKAKKAGQMLNRSAELTARKFPTAIRNPWPVENQLPWRLDGVPQEHKIAA
ncbi:hypothetical protein ACISSW_12170, partial [Escherichia coli]